MDCGCKREMRLIKVHSKRMVSGYIPGLLFVSCEASAAAQVQPFRSDSAFLLLLCLLDDQDGRGGHGRVLVPVADTNATERNEGTWSGRLFLFARARQVFIGDLSSMKRLCRVYRNAGETSKLLAFHPRPVHHDGPLETARWRQSSVQVHDVVVAEVSSDNKVTLKGAGMPWRRLSRLSSAVTA